MYGNDAGNAKTGWEQQVTTATKQKPLLCYVLGNRENSNCRWSPVLKKMGRDGQRVMNADRKDTLGLSKGADRFRAGIWGGPRHPPRTRSPMLFVILPMVTLTLNGKEKPHLTHTQLELSLRCVVQVLLLRECRTDSCPGMTAKTFLTRLGSRNESYPGWLLIGNHAI
ncbi:hypothetical protein BDQ17DRAFT_586418 [Cyathus striatus]|nr:hypothetical protein BDQ17DRAFT_586418 [Cyathus striatus]